MWRTFTIGGLASRGFRVLAATEVVQPAAEQRRWTNSNIKMTKVLKKMFNKRGGTKKKWFPGPVNVQSVADQDVDLNPRKKSVYSEGQKRRAHQVGRVLYDNIVQLVNSGQLSPQLANLSVDIVRVRVVPNFSTVNVYWLSTGSPEDQAVETLLKEHEGLLRQLLTSLHILGNIPRINFVRDDSRAHYLEVESLLSQADFGVDFVPTQPRSISVHDHITLKAAADSASPVTSLQAQFDQLSIQSGMAAAERWVAGTGPGGKEGKGSADDNQGRRCWGEGSADRKKSSPSNGSGHFKECTDSTPDVSGQAQHVCQTQSSGVSSSHQPSCSDAQPPGSQFLSDAVATSRNVTGSGKRSLRQQKMDRESYGFRDDLYRVPHTELLNKITARKQKAGTRPAMHDRAKQAELLMPAAKSASFKLMLQKKSKTKGRRASQSDYRTTGISGFSGWEHGAEDGLYDEEVDKSSAMHTRDEEPSPGK